MSRVDIAALSTPRPRASREACQYPFEARTPRTAVLGSACSRETPDALRARSGLHLSRAECDLGADARDGLSVGAAAVMLFALGSAWYLRRTSDAAVILTPTATHRMLLVAAAVFAPHFADAQATRPTVREGDSSIVAVIDAQLGALYPTYRPADALLTSSNPLGLPRAVGTEVQGFQEGGRVTRVVASAWTSYGKNAVEYFGAAGESPRFIFESALYRDDAPARPTGRNFRGQPLVQ